MIIFIYKPNRECVHQQQRRSEKTVDLNLCLIIDVLGVLPGGFAAEQKVA